MRSTLLVGVLLITIIVALLMHRAGDLIRGVSVRGLADETRIGFPPVSSPAFPGVAGPLLATAISAGHDVTVLTDRAVFDALLADLRSARHSITFFVYYCEPGRLATRVVELLAERARAGVRVLFMGDGFSCKDLVDEVGAQLQAAGVGIGLVRPVRWSDLHRTQHRNHSRLVVVDGTIGYTGGFGLADTWTGESGKPLWRDTSVRFTGPAVVDVQAAFLSGWAEATGILMGGTVFLPEESSPAPVHIPLPSDAAPSRRGVIAGFLFSDPGMGTTPVERFLALSLAGAQQSIRITNSYFVPTPLVRDLLINAAQRGVDVQLLLPGPQTDVASTRWAGRGFYERFLEAGIHIYEYEPRTLHAKTISIDGIWSAVGSLNIDNRSVRLNDESALLVWDREISTSLDSLFQVDLGRAREITLAEHRDRPLWDRILERATLLIAPLL